MIGGHIKQVDLRYNRWISDLDMDVAMRSYVRILSRQSIQPLLRRSMRKVIIEDVKRYHLAVTWVECPMLVVSPMLVNELWCLHYLWK